MEAIDQVVTSRQGIRDMVEALVAAENALDQNAIMCGRAKRAGIDHAGSLLVVTQLALREIRRALRFETGNIEERSSRD